MRSLSNSEIAQMLNGSKKELYKMKGHSFVPMKGVGKQVCSSCGLLALNNAATNWCVDKGCNYENHKSYEGAMKRLTKNI
ncbi:hypothetical protein [Pseudoalteromonas phage J2-1_QLiu-2017]|nr:hypothetical protein [Pseudoalteromonas phage J2-1_QLiu-2017]